MMLCTLLTKWQVKARLLHFYGGYAKMVWKRDIFGLINAYKWMQFAHL